MAGESLDFIQIIYDDVQAELCYPFARIYKNESLTPYFENSIIRTIVPTIGADRIGVASWRLQQKRGDMYRLVDKSLTKEKIDNATFDIAVLTPRSPTHKPLLMASHWHGQAWDDAFKVFKEFLRDGLHIRVRDELTHAIYENHFIAKREIYHEYVSTCLIPAIEFIDRTGGVFLHDAGYAKRKTEAERKRYTAITGRQDWPIAPFILERLFSIWIEGKKFNVIPL